MGNAQETIWVPLYRTRTGQGHMTSTPADPLPEFFRRKPSPPRDRAAVLSPSPSLEGREPFEAAGAARVTELRPMPAPSQETSARLFTLADTDYIINMNKVSLFGLIFGLALLGLLFFVAGFLVAVTLMAPTEGLMPQPAPQTSVQAQDLRLAPVAVPLKMQPVANFSPPLAASPPAAAAPLPPPAGASLPQTNLPPNGKAKGS